MIPSSALPHKDGARSRVPFRTRLAECQPDGIHWAHAKNPSYVPGERMILKVRRIALPLLAIVALAAACSKFQADKNPSPIPEQPIPHPTIVFMTDFGVANDAVAICKAVMLGIAPD